MKIEQYSRLINHRISTSGQKFTTPTSNDHTDETWLATDLYIGEIGINVSDDTIFFRSNNGIVQIAASSSGASASQLFVLSGSDIQISSAYSIDAVKPNGVYYTDLGTSAARWKGLYLGGSSTGIAQVNVNSGLNIFEQSGDGIMTVDTNVNDNAPIKIFATSSLVTKNKPLHLNSRDSYIYSTSGQVATIASNGVIVNSGVSNYLVAGSSVIIATNSAAGAHIGYGYNKINGNSYEVVIGGALAVRGIADDGTGQYDASDWTTKQTKLRTFDALWNTAGTIDFYTATASGGETIQVKAYVIGTKIDDASQVYGAEVMGLFNMAGASASQIGSTVRHEISNYGDLEAILEAVSPDNLGGVGGVDIRVKGTGTDTIQWLVTYSYHRLVKIM